MFNLFTEKIFLNFYKKVIYFTLKEKINFVFFELIKISKTLKEK